MELTRTIDDGRLLRLKADDGSEATILMDGDRARLLTLFVPEEERLEGTGTALLSLVEREAELRGFGIM